MIFFAIRIFYHVLGGGSISLLKKGRSLSEFVFSLYWRNPYSCIKYFPLYASHKFQDRSILLLRSDANKSKIHVCQYVIVVDNM